MLFSGVILAMPVLDWLSRFSNAALFLLAVAESIPMPRLGGSVELMTAALSARHPHAWAAYALLATAGSVFGGLVSHRLGEIGGARWLERRLGKARVERLDRRFSRHGGWLIAGGALLPPPFPFTAVLLTAGVARYPRRRFLVALALGRGVRYAMVAIIGFTWGPALVRLFLSHRPSASQSLAAVAIAAAAAALLGLALRRKASRGGR